MTNPVTTREWIGRRRLRAAGFRKVGMTEAKASGWSVPSRPRERPEKYPDGQKVIWEIRKGGDGCEQVRRL
jgi:hypothetical protein